MSAGELCHRGASAVSFLGLRIQKKYGVGGGEFQVRDCGQFEFVDTDKQMIPDVFFAEEPYPENDAALLDGKWFALGFAWTWRPGGDAWHKAPDTGRSWPTEDFARIDYRPGNKTGDVRVMWEPARLQQLVAMALLARRRPDMRDHAMRLLGDQILDWRRANPFLVGVHYISSMECALRTLALFHALDLSRALGLDAAAWREAIGLIIEHAQVIERRLSLRSSAGNHTIAEAVGLIYAGLLLPEIGRAAHWRDLGLRILNKEARRQVLQDGGGVEQAYWYHLFVVELIGLVVSLLTAGNVSVPPVVQTAFERGRAFLRAVASTPNDLPRIGDGDNGRALSPLLGLIWNEEVDSDRPRMRRFDESGYLFCAGGPDNRERVVFDCGPLGMSPGYGHGHADALQVLYECGGRPILIDPGTYMYGGDPGWRRYFRSTAAHNTVTIDRQDQALQQGPFLWSQPYKATLRHVEDLSDGGRIAIGCHDGYREISVIHWRTIVYDPEGYWVVYDLVDGLGEREVAIHWHTQARVEQCGGEFLLRSGPELVRVAMIGGEVSLHAGEQSPGLGWVSPSYGRLQVGSTLRLRYRGTLPSVLVTVISSGKLIVSAESLKARLSFIRQRLERVKSEQ